MRNTIARASWMFAFVACILLFVVLLSGLPMVPTLGALLVLFIGCYVLFRKSQPNQPSP
jgi:hypothetical protein